MEELISKLRLMIAESDDSIYTDTVLEEYIKSYPLIDVNGEEPTYLDYGTQPPTITDNPDWIPTYDLNAAAAEIWDEKAAGLQSKYDFSADGGSYSVKQAFDNAVKMAAKYRGRSSASSHRVFKSPKEVNDAVS